jgi:hypothetical protein
MNRRTLFFSIFYLSFCLLGCLVVAIVYHYRHNEAIVLGHKYCYRYLVLDGEVVSADVLLVNNENLAKKTIDYYNIKGNATFIGDITATISPFTRVDVLGYNTDSTIIKVRIVYKNLVHRYFSSSSGYVPAFTLHDTLPKSTITMHEYKLEMQAKNHIRDSIDSIASHKSTTEEIHKLRYSTAGEISRIEIRCIDYNTQQMQNLPCSDFVSGSKHNYYTIVSADSIKPFLTMFNKVMRFNAKDINLTNSAHYGGVTIFYKNHTNQYFCFDRTYEQIGDSAYLNTPEYNAYIRNIMAHCNKLSK